MMKSQIFRSALSLFREFWDDFKNVELLKIKLIYFTLLFAVVILWTQLSLHQSSLNLTELDTGIISVVGSVVVIVFPMISGIIADKIGNFKNLMSAVTVIGGISVLCFVFIPPAEGSDGTPASHAATFWAYLFVRTTFAILIGISFTTFETTVMAYGKAKNVDYGKQRAWGTIAALISSFLGGYIVDISSDEQTKNFNNIFYISAAINVFTGLMMLSLDITFKTPTKFLLREIRPFLNLEATVFLAAIFCAGMYGGCIETFVYRYLLNMGASTTLIGLTVTVASPIEFVLNVTATRIIRQLSHAPVIALGLLGYFARLIWLAFLSDPKLVLVLELFDAFASGLLFTAASMYCTVLATQGSIATLRALMGAAVLNIGKSTGAAIGTTIKERHSFQDMWIIFSGMALASSIFYFAFYLVYIRKRKAAFSLNPAFGTESQNSPTDLVPRRDKNEKDQPECSTILALSGGHINQGFSSGAS